MHACENEMVCKLTLDDIPYFNAGIYLENKSKVGKVEDIFGTTTEVVRRARRCRAQGLAGTHARSDGAASGRRCSPSSPTRA